MRRRLSICLESVASRVDVTVRDRPHSRDIKYGTPGFGQIYGWGVVKGGRGNKIELGLIGGYWVTGLSDRNWGPEGDFFLVEEGGV